MNFGDFHTIPCCHMGEGKKVCRAEKKKRRKKGRRTIKLIVFWETPSIDKQKGRKRRRKLEKNENPRFRFFSLLDISFLRVTAHFAAMKKRKGGGGVATGETRKYFFSHSLDVGKRKLCRRKFILCTDLLISNKTQTIS